MGRDSRPAPPTADEAPRERLSTEPGRAGGGGGAGPSAPAAGLEGRAARGPSRSAGAQPAAYPGAPGPSAAGGVGLPAPLPRS